jgi:hypothetical protein
MERATERVGKAKEQNVTFKKCKCEVKTQKNGISCKQVRARKSAPQSQDGQSVNELFTADGQIVTTQPAAKLKQSDSQYTRSQFTPEVDNGFKKSTKFFGTIKNNRQRHKNPPSSRCASGGIRLHSHEAVSYE